MASQSPYNLKEMCNMVNKTSTTGKVKSQDNANMKMKKDQYKRQISNNSHGIRDQNQS